MTDETFEEKIDTLGEWYEDCKNKIYRNDHNALEPLREIRDLCAVSLQTIESQKEILAILSEQVPKGAFPDSNSLRIAALEMSRRNINGMIDSQISDLRNTKKELNKETK